jgi:hypothetical protein
MQRFESRRPGLESWRIPILKCRGSTPPAPSGRLSLTHTESGRARNAAIWRTFRTQRWVYVFETGAGSRILALCLLGRYFGVTFLEYARGRSKFDGVTREKAARGSRGCTHYPLRAIADGRLRLRPRTSASARSQPAVQFALDRAASDGHSCARSPGSPLESEVSATSASWSEPDGQPTGSSELVPSCPRHSFLTREFTLPPRRPRKCATETASGRYVAKTAPVPPTSQSGRVYASLM